MLENLEKYKIILASNSPRRKELLSGLGIKYEVKTLPGIEETYPDTLKAEEIPLYIACEKAAAYRNTMHPDELIITADTIVWLDGVVMSKFSTYLTQTNNQDSVIAYNCGVCADKIKKPAEALKYFDIAVQKKYNLANAYIGKAGALKDLKKNDEYVATLKDGLEANPGNKTLTKLYATY